MFDTITAPPDEAASTSRPVTVPGPVVAFGPMTVAVATGLAASASGAQPAFAAAYAATAAGLAYVVPVVVWLAAVLALTAVDYARPVAQRRYYRTFAASGEDS